MKTNQLDHTAYYKPLDDRVCCILLTSPSESQGGVMLPENTKDPFFTPTAKVIAVGPNVKELKVGDTVLISMSTPFCRVNYKGQETMVLPEESVAGVLNG